MWENWKVRTGNKHEPSAWEPADVLPRVVSKKVIILSRHKQSTLNESIIKDNTTLNIYHSFYNQKGSDKRIRWWKNLAAFL